MAFTPTTQGQADFYNKGYQIGVTGVSKEYIGHIGDAQEREAFQLGMKEGSNEQARYGSPYTAIYHGTPGEQARGTAILKAAEIFKSQFSTPESTSSLIEKYAPQQVPTSTSTSQIITGRVSPDVQTIPLTSQLQSMLGKTGPPVEFTSIGRGTTLMTTTPTYFQPPKAPGPSVSPQVFYQQPPAEGNLFQAFEAGYKAGLPAPPGSTSTLQGAFPSSQSYLSAQQEAQARQAASLGFLSTIGEAARRAADVGQIGQKGFSTYWTRIEEAFTPGTSMYKIERPLTGMVKYYTKEELESQPTTRTSFEQSYIPEKILDVTKPSGRNIGDFNIVKVGENKYADVSKLSIGEKQAFLDTLTGVPKEYSGLPSQVIIQKEAEKIAKDFQVKMNEEYNQKFQTVQNQLSSGKITSADAQKQLEEYGKQLESKYNQQIQSEIATSFRSGGMANIIGLRQGAEVPRYFTSPSSETLGTMFKVGEVVAPIAVATLGGPIGMGAVGTYSYAKGIPLMGKAILGKDLTPQARVESYLGGALGVGLGLGGMASSLGAITAQQEALMIERAYRQDTQPDVFGVKSIRIQMGSKGKVTRGVDILSTKQVQPDVVIRENAEFPWVSSPKGDVAFVKGGLGTTTIRLSEPNTGMWKEFGTMYDIGKGPLGEPVIFAPSAAKQITNYRGGIKVTYKFPEVEDYFSGKMSLSKEAEEKIIKSGGLITSTRGGYVSPGYTFTPVAKFSGKPSFTLGKEPLVFKAIKEAGIKEPFAGYTIPGKGDTMSFATGKQFTITGKPGKQVWSTGKDIESINLRNPPELVGQMKISKGMPTETSFFTFYEKPSKTGAGLFSSKKGQTSLSLLQPKPSTSLGEVAIMKLPKEPVVTKELLRVPTLVQPLPTTQISTGVSTLGLVSSLTNADVLLQTKEVSLLEPTARIQTETLQLKPITVQEPITIVQPALKVSQAQTQTITTTTTEPFITPTRPSHRYTPVPPFYPLPPFDIKKRKPMKFSKFKVQAKPAESYLVKTVKKGKDILVSPVALSRGEALSLGLKVTKTSPRATFKLEKTQARAGSLGLTPISERQVYEMGFRPPVSKGKVKLGKDIFIQKRATRLSNPLEYRAVQAERRVKWL